jgi:hypothetical protein
MSNYYLSLPKLPDTNDPKLYEQLEPLYLALHSVNKNFLYACGVSRISEQDYGKYLANPVLLQPQNLNRLIVTAGVDLAFGSLINLYMAGSVVTARPAVGGGSIDYKAVGFCNVPGGVEAGDLVEVVINTGLLAVAGATINTSYFLSTTPGSLSTVAPGAGLIQQVGHGIMPGYVYINCF